jgi:hypothetical protein
MEKLGEEALPPGFIVLSGKDQSPSEQISLPKTVVSSLKDLHKIGLLSKHAGNLRLDDAPASTGRKRRIFASPGTPTVPNMSVQYGTDDTRYVVPIETFANQLLVFQMDGDYVRLTDHAITIFEKASKLFSEASQRLSYARLSRYAGIYTWEHYKGLQGLISGYSVDDFMEITKLQMPLDKLIAFMEQGTPLDTIRDFSELPDAWLAEALNARQDDDTFFL